MGFVFKPPLLMLNVKLKKWDKYTISRFIKYDAKWFFLSPMVMNTRDFVILATGNQLYLNSNEVEIVELLVKDKIGSFFWNETYKLNIKAYARPSPTPLPSYLYN